MSPTTSGASAATPTAPAKRNKKELLPTSQLALSTLALAAAKAWLASELPALLFVSKAAFSAQAISYAASLGTADAADDGASPQANRLKTLDKLIAKNLGFVKGYLAEDHDQDGGESYYAEFGIAREGKNFRLPTARTARAGALGKLVAALAAHKYDKKKFGTAFWQPIATEYAELAKGSDEARGAASAAVGRKNALEAPLRRVLSSLVLSIKANYPDEDTQRGVLRAFGFQKEVY
ncbi:hypothetical protein ACFST9_09660 [Hymenobacter monticola]|uniref:Uncharacterized protein n=1 Tax=Hymenobacter monticola TaxID=1705399 RepID=A0ABY4B906_9BACT|nr:hypothetical protein [Hymenobacter monticola]UOE35535.1 hypothetical protein MTP16_07745 [Hymenobacter monticola]